LAHAAWNRGTLNNPNPIFIRFHRDIEIHKLILADITFDYIHQGIDALVRLR
jgi:hypothetical protein